MKIHNHLPVGSKSTQKSKRSSAPGVFSDMFVSELGETQAISKTPSPESQQSQEQGWESLQQSVDLLDQAMQCLESGGTPPQQLIHDIDQLRSQLRQQTALSVHAAELKQADTLLAVEAERIRSLQS